MIWFYDLRNIYTLKYFTVLNIRKDIPSSTLLAKKNPKKQKTSSLVVLYYLYLFGESVIFCSFPFHSYNHFFFFNYLPAEKQGIVMSYAARCDCIFALFSLGR